MTARQLALDCEPTWLDPEPDDDEDAPWFPDLGGQGLNIVRLHTMTTLTVSQEYL